MPKRMSQNYTAQKKNIDGGTVNLFNLGIDRPLPSKGGNKKIAVRDRALQRPPALRKPAVFPTLDGPLNVVGRPYTADVLKITDMLPIPRTSRQK